MHTLMMPSNDFAAAAVSSPMGMPLHAPALLGIFREALDSSLIERGAVQGIELLGSVDAFWRALGLSELERMAVAGNHAAQAELAWRHAVGESGAVLSYEHSLRWATPSAEAGCAAGEAVLGWLLYHGFGVPRDETEAARLFASAAGQDDQRGLTWLALCTLRGHGLAADGGHALALFRRAADRGGSGAALAQYWLGRIHYLGLPELDVQDFSEAVFWLRQASGHGHERAHELLARCCFFGRGQAEDRGAALALWRKAGEAGSAVAMYCAGMCLHAGITADGQPDHAEAARWLRAAARKHLPGAMFLLGQCHVFGLGVVQDWQAGLGWYRRAAELGNREAEFELAEWHAFGRGGLPQDMPEAILWYRRAAEQGHVQAQRKLGHCYRNGDGIAEDKAQAVGWYRRAADGQDGIARIWLGECLEQGEGVARDPGAAVVQYRLAAEAGLPHGQAELGRCYLQGIGVAADLVQGERLLRAAAEAGWAPALGELERHCFARAEQLMQWAGVDEKSEGNEEWLREAVRFYRKAGELGHRRAACRLASCYRQGRGVAVDDLQAMNWYRKAARLFEAKVALADLYYFGYQDAQGQRLQDFPAALRWYEQAVEQYEDAYAMYRLGYCLLHGQGCPVEDASQQAGVRWLRKAAALGEAGAQYALGCAYADGHGRMHNARLAVKWLRRAAQQGHQAARTFLQEMGAH